MKEDPPTVKITERLSGYVRKVLACYVFRFHDWTCASAEGVPATPKQIADGIDGFYDYARMYCKRCGKESELSERARAKHERLAKNGS